MTDYTMPGLDGADVLHAVSSRWPDITRILLTGNADTPAAARAVNEGRVSRLCTKPWRPDEVAVEDRGDAETPTTEAAT